jgi:hypothetical protein
MLTHYPYQTLGHADHGWLKSKHHFSFAHYYNPARMGFGKLRVINDDWVAGGTGFPAHPHSNMEIISVIRSGAITHQDSTGNKGVTEAGEVQVMSAGTGIVHSEYNRSQEPLTFYQIWLETNKNNIAPRWESKKFPTQPQAALTLLASGYDEDKDTALYVNQQVRIFGGQLAQGTVIAQPIHHQAYILASVGSFIVTTSVNASAEKNAENVTMHKGDGLEVKQCSTIALKATTACEIIIIDTIP